MEEENFTVENSDRLTIKSADKITIVRDVNIGGYTIPYEIVVNYKDLPKGKEEFYLNILTKLL
jgi:hypothetical protein